MHIRRYSTLSVAFSAPDAVVAAAARGSLERIDPLIQSSVGLS